MNENHIAINMAPRTNCICLREIKWYPGLSPHWCYAQPYDIRVEFCCVYNGLVNYIAASKAPGGMRQLMQQHEQQALIGSRAPANEIEKRKEGSGVRY